MKDPQMLILKKLDELKETLGGHSKILEGHTNRLERIEDKQDALSGDVEQLHMDVKGIRDDIGLKHQRDKKVLLGYFS